MFKCHCRASDLLQLLRWIIDPALLWRLVVAYCLSKYKLPRVL